MENVVTAFPRAEFWRDKKVFLTGHTGFKGSWLTAWLAQMGAKVTGYSLDPMSPSSMFEMLALSRSCARDLRGDVRDLKNLKNALHECSPDIVLHLAAQPLVLESYLNPVDTYAVNVMGTVNLLESCREQKSVRAIIIVTTDKVYENHESERGYRETDRLGGKDPYSSSKACAELVTQSYRDSFLPSVPVITCRAGNVVGGGDEAANRLVPDAFRAFRSGQPVKVRRPNSRRPWQHVLEPLRGYLVTAEAAFENRVRSCRYNFGPRDVDNWSVREVMTSLCAQWGEEARWEDTSGDPRFGGDAPAETTLLKLDCGRALAELAWAPVFSIEEALRLSVEWTRTAIENPDHLRELTLKQIKLASSPRG